MYALSFDELTVEITFIRFLEPPPWFLPSITEKSASHLAQNI